MSYFFSWIWFYEKKNGFCFHCQPLLCKKSNKYLNIIYTIYTILNIYILMCQGWGSEIIWKFEILKEKSLFQQFISQDPFKTIPDPDTTGQIIFPDPRPLHTYIYINTKIWIMLQLQQRSVKAIFSLFQYVHFRRPSCEYCMSKK